MIFDGPEPAHTRESRASALEQGDGEFARRRVLRQEAHRHRIIAGRGQGEALGPCPVAQQGVRNLDEDAGAVAQQRVAPDRAAMIEVEQDLQPAADRRMRLLPLDVRDEADPS